MKRTLLTLMICASLGACSTRSHTNEMMAQEKASTETKAHVGHEQLMNLADNYFEEGLKLDPFFAPYLGDYRYDDQFGNELSDETLAAEHALHAKYLAALNAMDRSVLSEEDQLNYDILRYNLEMHIEGERFPDELLPFNQFYSRALTFAQFGSGESAQPFATAKDYNDFLKKIDGFPIWVDSAIQRLRQGMAKRVVFPKILVQRMLPQLQEQIASDYTKSLFWQPLTHLPAGLTDADKLWLQEAYRKAIIEKINPGYRKLYDFLKNDYLPKARASSGYGALPDGQAWYAYEVKLNTTTDMTPEQVHELGLSEVARIRAEMEQVKTQVGFKGDLPAFLHYLNTDDRFYFKSGDELIARYKLLKKRINAVLPKYFHVMPKSDYEIRPVEAFRAASAAGGSYEAGTPDGSRPGIFYINTYNLRAQPIFGMETLSLHEAAPGHHFQISIQQEMKDLPKFRRFGSYTAFEEGWALYSESIGKEIGMFTDPYQYYGRLADEMLRAMRLVVDTGLHAKGWTREQAIAYMRANSSMADSDIVAEVERYMAIPGQALAYKVGQLKITELRHYAEQELGPKFDIKEFHDEVLTSGAMPMAILEAKIKHWVERRKNR